MQSTLSSSGSAHDFQSAVNVLLDGTETESTVTTPTPSNNGIDLANTQAANAGRGSTVPQYSPMAAATDTTQHTQQLNTQTPNDPLTYTPPVPLNSLLADSNTVRYNTGFHNSHETEAVKGALPVGQNNPQRCPFNLYPEQISGTAFTKGRANNQSSWCYRIMPSVALNQRSIATDAYPHWCSDPKQGVVVDEPLRWGPPNLSTSSVSASGETEPSPRNFIDSIFTFATNQLGALSWYDTQEPMGNTYFCNSNAEMMVVPQAGGLKIKTEMGVIFVEPKEIAVIPKGIKFQADPIEQGSRGYMCESFESNFKLPDRGPIGANGLANERDFQYPTAGYEKKTFDESAPGKLIKKRDHQFFQQEIQHSPLNVVAWHGTYAPFKYALERFNTMNTVSFDHPDPSIFTVMTAPSSDPGTANIDFVIFPSRWMVAEDTFRPPYFHENIMAEAMISIHGVYDAKPSGFAPGGVSLHNPWSPHGPEAEVFKQASTETLSPMKLPDTLACMFESRETWYPTEQALNHPSRDENYLNCWSNFAAADI